MKNVYAFKNKLEMMPFVCLGIGTKCSEKRGATIDDMHKKFEYSLASQDLSSVDSDDDCSTQQSSPGIVRG